MNAIRSAAAFAILALIGLTVAAFWPAYLGKPFATVDRYTHAHAALGAAWLLLLLGQTVLIQAGKRGAHRALGKASYVAAPLFLLSGVLLAHFRFARMDEATFAREAYTLYLPLSAALLFLGAWALALVHRRRVVLHGCFMLCTALVLVDPVVARVLAFHVVRLREFWHYQIITFSIELVILVALLRALPPRSADRSAFARYAAGFGAVQALWFVLPRAAAWLPFAEWFRRLPLT